MERNGARTGLRGSEAYSSDSFAKSDASQQFIRRLCQSKKEVASGKIMTGIQQDIYFAFFLPRHRVFVESKYITSMWNSNPSSHKRKTRVWRGCSIYRGDLIPGVDDGVSTPPMPTCHASALPANGMAVMIRQRSRRVPAGAPGTLKLTAPPCPWEGKRSR